MPIIEIHYDAKCKHCRHRKDKLNERTNRMQSYCEVHGCFVTLKNKSCEEFIDCGWDRQLFLYTAAIRDDSDNFQLFFNNKDTDCKYPIECIHNEFHMFTIDPYTCEGIDHTNEYHKGTPNELQKHFLNK